MADMTPEFAAGYLSAMIDGEGTVENCNRVGKKQAIARGVSVYNMDEGIVDAVVEACDTLEIPFKLCQISRPKMKLGYIYQIYFRTFESQWLILKYCDLRSVEKLRRLKAGLRTYTGKATNRYFGRNGNDEDAKEELREVLEIDQEMTNAEKAEQEAPSV